MRWYFRTDLIVPSVRFLSYHYVVMWQCLSIAYDRIWRRKSYLLAYSENKAQKKLHLYIQITDPAVGNRLQLQVPLSIKLDSSVDYVLLRSGF